MTDILRMLPKEFEGRDNRNYLIEPKSSLKKIFNCRDKEIEIKVNSDGKKHHIEGSDIKTHWQFFINLQKNSPNKEDGDKEDNRIFLQPEDRHYCIDFDCDVNVDSLPPFIKDIGFYTISTNGHLHYYFKCKEDIRDLLSNKCAYIKTLDGEISNDIDMKDMMYEKKEGFIYYTNIAKNMYVSRNSIERFIIGNPVAVKKQTDENNLNCISDDTWKNLMWLCVQENQNWSGWSTMSFRLPKRMKELFYEWSSVGYDANRDECDRFFENGKHLPEDIGFLSLIKCARIYSESEVEDILSDVKIMRHRKFLSITNRKCAELFYNFHRDDYAYTSTSGWFKKDKNGGWKCTGEYSANFLNKVSLFIGNKLRIIRKEIIEYEKECIEIDESNEKVKEELLEKIVKLNKKLKDDTTKTESFHFIKDVIKFLEGLYIKEESFDPSRKVGDDTVNTFSGFNAELLKEKYNEIYTNYFIEHLYYIFDENKEAVDYTLNWLADIIQHPESKSRTSIVISGYQGTGKDLIYDIMRTIIGSKYCHSATSIESEIFGKFNGCIRGKLLVNLGEISGALTSKYDDSFKKLITGYTDTTQLKGREPLEHASYCRYFCTSNRADCAKIDNDDRRFFVYRSEAQPREKSYYDNLVKLMNTDGFIRSVYVMLLTRNIDGFDWIGQRPKTEFSQLLKESSLSPMISFLQYLFEDEKVMKEGYAKFTDMWINYLTHCGGMGITEEKCGTKNKLGLTLGTMGKKYGLEKMDKKIDGKKFIIYKINFEALRDKLVQSGLTYLQETPILKKLSH